MPPSFCRHNRFIDNCPICRPSDPPPPRGVPRALRPRHRRRVRPHAARRGRAAAAPCACASSRRRPTTATAPSSSPASRRPPTPSASPTSSPSPPPASPSSPPTRPRCTRTSPRSTIRGGALAGVPRRLHRPAARRRGPVRGDPRRARAVGVGRDAGPRRHARPAHGRRPGGRRAHDPRLPRLGRARRQPGGGLRRRAVVDARAPLRSRVRAPRAAGPRPRPALRAARVARAPRGSSTCARRRCSSATTTRRPPPSACSGSATRSCSSAGRATLADAAERADRGARPRAVQLGRARRRAGDVRLGGGGGGGRARGDRRACSASEPGGRTCV